MKTPRNARCPCGSGKKYKVCHGMKSDEGDRSKLAIGLIGAVLVFAAGAFAYTLATSDVKLDDRIWSAEHGHWHDKDGNEIGAAAAPSGPVAPPPGPAPAGKVWSAEHGHWHDADGSEVDAAPAAAAEPPPGEAPPGKVWNAEHGHYHDAEGGH